MIANLWMGFREDASASAHTKDNNGNKHKVTKAIGDVRVSEIFRKDRQGNKDYELWSLYYEVETEQQLRDIRNDLNAEFPGQVRTIGAWWWDGRMVGTEFTYDAEGAVTGTSGNPIFPLHTRILGFMPDEVRYNKQGQETGRSRPTSLSDVNLGMGQAPRRFT